jgi:hypothetical protein
MSSKYHCETCNFGSNYISIWNQHIETTKHKNNGKTIRYNKKEPLNKKCDKCNFIAKHSEGLMIHNLIQHSSVEEKEKEFTYYCKECDFGTFYENTYIKHCQTKKHLLIQKCLDEKNKEINNLINLQKSAF